MTTLGPLAYEEAAKTLDKAHESLLAVGYDAGGFTFTFSHSAPAIVAAYERRIIELNMEIAMLKEMLGQTSTASASEPAMRVGGAAQ
jgi:hypothetical protein